MTVLAKKIENETIQKEVIKSYLSAFMEISPFSAVCKCFNAKF